MNDYKFESYWVTIIELPPSGTRCLVTDGEHITIATFVSSGEPPAVWLFSEVVGQFDIISWMPLPKTFKKNTISAEVNSVDNKE